MKKERAGVRQWDAFSFGGNKLRLTAWKAVFVKRGFESCGSDVPRQPQQ